MLLEKTRFVYLSYYLWSTKRVTSYFSFLPTVPERARSNVHYYVHSNSHSLCKLHTSSCIIYRWCVTSTLMFLILHLYTPMFGAMNKRWECMVSTICKFKELRFQYWWIVNVLCVLLENWIPKSLFWSTIFYFTSTCLAVLHPPHMYKFNHWFANFIPYNANIYTIVTRVNRRLNNTHSQYQKKLYDS